MGITSKTYTVRSVDGLAPIVWQSEVWFTGTAWQVTLLRNGIVQVESIDPNAVTNAIATVGTTREYKARHAIARKLLAE